MDAQIKEWHSALREKTRALEHSLGLAGNAHAAVVPKALEQLEDFGLALREHFAMEERGGYMSVALRANPALAQQAERLELEHAELCERLELLLEQARLIEGHPDRGPEFTRGVAAFLETLRTHEAAENDLVERAFGEG